MPSIKATIVPVSRYHIKYKLVELPKESKNYQIQCFDLDEFRKRKVVNDEKIELE